MYICLCYGVSDKKIKKMVDQGTNTMKAISACGAGTDAVSVFVSYKVSFQNLKSLINC